VTTTDITQDELALNTTGSVFKLPAGEVKLVLYVIAGMTAYAFLLDLLGFLFCTFLLVAFYLKVIAARRWPVTLSFAAAVALASHFFFDVLLKAEMPRGLLSWLI